MENNENVQVEQEVMDIPETKVTPEVVQTVVEPSRKFDMDATLNKIRAEEKRKHQADNERLKKELEELRKVTKELQDKEKSELEKLIGHNKELETKVVESERIKAEYENALKAKDVEIYKTKKLMEAGGELIPELVRGNTQEEIDASLELAKLKYAEIVENISKKAQKAEKPHSPSNPQSHISKQDKVDPTQMDVSTMSLEDYKKNRDMLRKTANKLAGSIFS